MSGPEILRERDLRMTMRLGQGGAAGWRHEPWLRVAADLPRALSCVPLLGPVAVSVGDGAPATVAALRLRVSGRALYAAGLYPDGPAGVDAAAFDRWVLREFITVKWASGFALWRRAGRGRWLPGVAWWRHADRSWSYGKHSAIPS
ncbi:MAG: hypothetical protein V4515_14335 [Chloroflexota bacterium]